MTRYLVVIIYHIQIIIDALSGHLLTPSHVESKTSQNELVCFPAQHRTRLFQREKDREREREDRVRQEDRDTRDRS